MQEQEDKSISLASSNDVTGIYHPASIARPEQEAVDDQKRLHVVKIRVKSVLTWSNVATSVGRVGEGAELGWAWKCEELERGQEAPDKKDTQSGSQEGKEAGELSSGPLQVSASVWAAFLIALTYSSKINGEVKVSQGIAKALCGDASV